MSANLGRPPGQVSSGEEMTVRKLLVASQNGGVGKTTTSINLAAAAAKAGARVLLLDADPVGSIAHLLNLSDHPQRKSFEDLDTPLPGALTSEALPGLDVLTPYDNSPCSDQELDKLLRATASNTIEQQYDCLIVNTPPFLGSKPFQLLSTCDELILVMRADPLATRTLPAFLELINRHAKSGNSIRMKGILLTLPESEEDGTRWEQELRGRCGRRLFPEAIPHDSRIERGEGNGEVAVLTDPDSPVGSSYLRVAAYLELPSCAGTHADTNRQLPELLKDVIEAMPKDAPVSDPDEEETVRITKRTQSSKATPTDKKLPKSNNGRKSASRSKHKSKSRKGSKSRHPAQTQEAQRPLRLRFEPMKKTTTRVRKGSGQGNDLRDSGQGDYNIDDAKNVNDKKPRRRSPDPYSMSSVSIFLFVAVGMGFTIGLIRVVSLSMPVIIGILCSVCVLVGYILFYHQNARATQRSKTNSRLSKQVETVVPNPDKSPANGATRRTRNRPSRTTRRPIRPS